MEDTAIVTVACAKGGTGKTTTVMLLAASLHVRGLEPVVLDADNTGGATKWADTADETGHPLPYPVIPVNRAVLDRGRLLRRYAGRVMLVDTPPSDTGMIQAAMDVADVTVIPSQTGSADLRLAGETYAGARHGVVLLTRVKPRTRLARRAVDDLDSLDVTRFENVIPEREAIRGAYGSARSDASYAAVAGELLDYMRVVRGEDGV